MRRSRFARALAVTVSMLAFETSSFASCPDFRVAPTVAGSAATYSATTGDFNGDNRPDSAAPT